MDIIYPYNDPEMGKILMERDGLVSEEVEFQPWMAEFISSDIDSYEEIFFSKMIELINDPRYEKLPRLIISRALVYFHARNRMSDFDDGWGFWIRDTIEFGAQMFLELLLAFDEKDHVKFIYAPYHGIVFSLRNLFWDKKYSISDLAQYYRLFCEQETVDTFGVKWRMSDFLSKCGFRLEIMLSMFIDSHRQSVLDDVVETVVETMMENEKEEEKDPDVHQHSQICTLENQKEIQSTIGTMQRMCARL